MNLNSEIEQLERDLQNALNEKGLRTSKTEFKVQLALQADLIAKRQLVPDPKEQGSLCA